MAAGKERLVILGTGWAGYELARKLCRSRFDVHVVSPRNYFVFTPLLASTCTGTVEFRSVIEPIRKLAKPTSYYQASCTGIDLANKKITCETLENRQFNLPYDRLVLAVGAKSNTFGIEGVQEHALFLKEIEDARRIRHRILDCFERAKQPGITSKERQDLLHFAVVGGGPTGVEFAAELNDLISEDLAKIYKDLLPLVKITVYDVAPRILGSFEQSLAEFAMRKFARAGIEIRTGTRISRVAANGLVLEGTAGVKEWRGAGMVVWATGLTASAFLKSLGASLAMDRPGVRLLTNEHLQVQDLKGTTLPHVYALGDCGHIASQDLPCTAQVALQQAKYLARALNSPKPEDPFLFASRGMMAYVGGWNAIADMQAGKRHWPGSGRLAWLLWRSAYFVMTVSWRNKVLIPMYWFLSWTFGRDISRI